MADYDLKKEHVQLAVLDAGGLEVMHFCILLKIICQLKYHKYMNLVINDTNYRYCPTFLKLKMLNVKQDP